MKMDFDPKRDAITDDNDVIIGYNATINFTDGDRTVSFNVRCQADADQNPNGQWETIAYRNLKNQDN